MDHKSTTNAFDVFGAEVYLNSTLEPDQLGWYAGDSVVIGNYAHTPMVDDYFAEEALVHGGWLYNEWNATSQPITLLVSDFGRWDAGEPAWTELETFEAALLRGHHPFRQVVVVRPSENVSAASYMQLMTGAERVEEVTFQQVARNGSVWLDWCTAPISTPWFLYTNVFFDFRHRVDLLTTRNGSSPIASYIPSGSSYCQDSEVCVYSMGRAKNYTGYEPTGHVDISQLVVNTAQRDAFCAEWQRWYKAASSPACDPIPGPTADDYTAYLLSKGATTLYSWENVLYRGQRSLGVQRSFPVDTRPCAFPASAANTSLCDIITEESTCGSVPGCSWRPHFDVCFEGTLVTVPTPPTLNVSYGNPLGCSVDFAMPLLLIHNWDSRNVTVQVPWVPGWQYTLAPSMVVELPAWNMSEDSYASGSSGVMQPVLVVSTSPHILLQEQVPLYTLQNFKAIASPQQTYIGNRISVSPSIAVSRLELRTVAGISPLSPVEITDGWMGSTDSAAPNLLVVDTAALPRDTSQLSLDVRLTGYVASFKVQRCTTLIIELVPTATVPCTSTLLLSSYSGVADSTVTANLTSSSSLGNVSSFTWTLGASFPITTSVPTATLPLPLVPTTTNVTFTAVVVDTFGRSMTCQADVTVFGANVAVVLEAAQTECSPYAISSSNLRCLQMATVLAAANHTEGKGSEVLDVLVQTLASVAVSLQANQSAETNAVLAHLSTLATISTAASNSQLQSALISVLDHVIGSCPVDGSSAAPLLAAFSPLLGHLTDVSELSSGANNASGSNQTQDVAQRVADALDQAAIKVASSQSQLFSTSEAQSATQCVNLTWGFQTAGSLPGQYSGLVMTPTLARFLPPTVRLVIASITSSCNVFRTTLGSDAQVHRLLLLNGTSGELLTAAKFLQLTGGTVDLWRAPLVFETSPATADSNATSQGSKFVVQETTQQAVQAMCVTVNPITGEQLKFSATNNTCGMRFPGSVSGIWTSVTPPAWLLTNETSAAADHSADSGSWTIAVGAGAAAAGCVVASATAFWFGRKRCRARRDVAEGREPAKVYAAAEVPVDNPLRFLPMEKGLNEVPTGELLEPLPIAKSDKPGFRDTVGDRSAAGWKGRAPFRGLPPLSSMEEWRRRSTLYSLDSAGNASVHHVGLELHPSPFPSARTSRQFSLAMQDDPFEDEDAPTPHGDRRRGLPAPLSPRRHSSVGGPLPHSTAKRLVHGGMCEDQSSCPSPHDGPTSRWDDRSYPDWYLLPRRRSKDKPMPVRPHPATPSAGALLEGRPSGADSFAPTEDAPWHLITPMLPLRNAEGPSSRWRHLPPPVSFDEEDGTTADEEGMADGVPVCQPMTPRVAWGVVDTEDMEEAAVTGSSTRRKDSHNLTLLEDFDSSDEGNTGSLVGLPREPFEAWRRRSTIQSDGSRGTLSSQMDLVLPKLPPSLQSVGDGDEGEDNRPTPSVRVEPPTGINVPRPIAVHNSQMRRRSELVPSATRPEYRCASLCIVSEDGTQPSLARPPLRAWDGEDAGEAGQRVPPRRRMTHPAPVPQPPSVIEELDCEDVEDNVGSAREVTAPWPHATSLPSGAPSPIPRPVRRQSSLGDSLQPPTL
eukprot:GGOE01022325.1.p1 GENE.GGOE01022325.1~~GGOE01022325.1.p1  ORF type:complete len:1836 (-),score=267.68 GGOE01022325.1:222-5009(-)